MSECDGLVNTEIVKCGIEGNYKIAWIWTASTGRSGAYAYIAPSPWEYDPNYFDEMGPMGSHGGCPNCIMYLIHLRKPNVIPCVPVWVCETPLNGYEKDGCGNRRVKAACSPPSPPLPSEGDSTLLVVILLIAVGFYLMFGRD